MKKNFSLLALETSTEACSVAVYYENKIYSRYSVAPQQHAMLILPMCEELLSETELSPTQLSAIAFGRGPGSFTGVRIAAAAAQGIAAAHDLPVIPVSCLQALAQQAFLQKGAEKVIAGIDARRNEVYLAKFILQQSVMQSIYKEVLISVENIQDLIPKTSGEWFQAGSAFQKENILFPSAEAVMAIALDHWQNNNFLKAEDALPVYIRNNI